MPVPRSDRLRHFFLGDLELLSRTVFVRHFHVPPLEIQKQLRQQYWSKHQGTLHDDTDTFTQICTCCLVTPLLKNNLYLHYVALSYAEISPYTDRLLTRWIKLKIAYIHVESAFSPLHNCIHCILKVHSSHTMTTSSSSISLSPLYQKLRWKDHHRISLSSLLFIRRGHWCSEEGKVHNKLDPQNGQARYRISSLWSVLTNGGYEVVCWGEVATWFRSGGGWRVGDQFLDDDTNRISADSKKYGRI